MTDLDLFGDPIPREGYAKPDPPRVRNTDPATSHQAADSLGERALGARCQQVYAFIEHYGGLTTHQVVQLSHDEPDGPWDRGNTARRITDLRQAGWIHDQRHAAVRAFWTPLHRLGASHMTAPDPAEAIFDDLWAARLARVDTQLERIANTTYWLGRKLARHEITRDDVNRRIDTLCVQLPVDDPAWVPWHMARDAALAGLRRGMGVDQ